MRLDALIFISVSLLATATHAEGGDTGGDGDAPVVLIRTVEEDAAQTIRRYPARVRAIEQVDVVSRLSADIVEIGFMEGSMVKRGQLLYRLDETRFAASASNHFAQVDEIKSKLSLAEITFRRKEKLVVKGAVAQAEYDEALASKRGLEASLESARSALALAEDDLRHTRIFSPLDGRIGLTAKTVGNYVTQESGMLATIVKTDPLRIRFSLSMADYARLFGCDEKRLKSEAEIHVELPDGMEPLPKGEIEFVDLKAVERTDTVLVYLRQPNPGGLLVPDSAATLVMSVASSGTMPWVPPQAVIEDGDESFVYVVEEGTASLREVEVGARLPARVFVKSGIKAGDVVVVGGTHKISDGASVRVKEAQ